MSPNPYIIGTPILNINQLFGREKLLRTIEDSLQQNTKFILLHGQRRIGKSSVLKNIPLFISQDQFVFVPCDLQHHSYSSLGEILYAIANAIVEYLNIDSSILDSLEPRYLDENPKVFTWRLLAKVLDSLGNKKLVLLLDEFDVVSQNNTKTASDFLRFLDNLVRPDEELFVIAVVGRYIDSIPTLVQYFRDGIYQKIDLLDYESAKQQITQPTDGSLLYQQKSLEEILKFSAGHPYYTQILCHVIFNKARNENYSTILPDFVNDAVKNAIECAEGGLASIWDGLSIPEKVVISAVAEAKKSNTIQNPLKLLESYGLVLTNSLEEAIQLLINKGFLDSNPVKIKVELVRLWLLERHPLKDEIKNLETIQQQNVNQLLCVARNCWQEGKQQNAVNVYEEALQLNPNHFSLILELAEKYLELKNFDKSLKLHQRVYKLDRTRYEENLIEALNQYGHWLITEKNYVEAKQQYTKILQIKPENSLAKQKIAEIQSYKDGRNNNKNNAMFFRRQFLSMPVLLIILVLISGAGIVTLGNWIFNSCPAGQEKKSVFFCASNIKISRGDRTLFPSIENSDRDKGIKSFEQKNYIQAAKDFEKAFSNNNNHPDPEVLIYKNNALAHQKGNPLTLATVVPATNRTSSAQEILRGVAQAQNQFNQQNGLNGRLLEIVIADDENKENTGKLVADELVKNKSILGVIGHGSSHVTDAALPIYTLAKLAVISPTSSSTKFYSPVFFRTVNSNKVTGKNLAEYAWKLKLKKLVIFCNPNDTYSNTMREEFRVTFMANLGAEIVGGGANCIHNLAAPGFNADREVQNIVLDKNPPQAIVLFPDTQHLKNAGTVAKAHKDLIDKLQQRGSDIQKLKLLGGDVLYDDKFLNEYSDALEGLVLSIPWFREAPKSKEFAQKSKDQWRGDVSWRTATSFDATQIFIESFKKSSNPSLQTVLANLPQINILPKNTSGEEIKFDPISREIKRDEILVILQQNRKLGVIPK